MEEDGDEGDDEAGGDKIVSSTRLRNFFASCSRWRMVSGVFTLPSRSRHSLSCTEYSASSQLPSMYDGDDDDGEDVEDVGARKLLGGLDSALLLGWQRRWSASARGQVSDQSEVAIERGDGRRQHTPAGTGHFKLA